MRKFVVILILLIVVAGTAFYFGWVQFRLPPGTVGVVFTKTSGWDSDVLEAGEFSWRWEALLPTNLTLYVVDAEPVTVDVSSRGNLPSGALYGGFLEGAPTFDYEVRFDVSYRVDLERLPGLLEEGVIEGNDVSAWYESMNDRIETQALELVADAMEATSESSPGERVSGFSQSMQQRLSSAISEAEIVSVSPRRITLPDVGLYREAREIYFSAMDARRAAIEEAMASASTGEVFEEARLGALRRYGEVLAEYPVLLDYFRLGADEGVDPLNLRDLRPEGPGQ